MSWMRDHVQGAKRADYASRVLARYRLGIKAGGAIAGVRIVAAADACPACLALADIVYDPDSAPLLPFAECARQGGCRCAYTPVMTYEQDRWGADHRPKSPEYAPRVLALYGLGSRAGGAIGGVRVVASEDSCGACLAVGLRFYDPEVAPQLPLAACTAERGCRCAYATAMAYEVPGRGARDPETCPQHGMGPGQ